MSNAIWGARSTLAPILVVLAAGCSAESPNMDAPVGVAGTQGVIPGAAGTSSGVAGQAGAARGAAGTGAVNSRGSSGSSGGAAGSGNGASGTGSIGVGGSGGSAAQSGTAGAPAMAGTGAQVGGMSGGAAGAPGGAAGMGGSSAPTAGCEVAPITAEMRSKYRNMNETYYTKFADANGVIVATGAKVDDAALTRYCRLVTEMFSNDKVRQAIINDKMWFTMISEDEQLSSLPQINRDYGSSLNQRARGLGGLTPTICAEDSIMCMPGDRWKGDCICPHETGHTMYSSGIAKVPELSSRLTQITKDTRASGRIANSYVWMDGNESGMMAWGVQVWYDCAINGTRGAYHPDINTRAELEKELPEFHEFLSELLPADNNYEDCYANP